MKRRLSPWVIGALPLLSAGLAAAQEPAALDVPVATTSLRATFLAVELDPETLEADRDLVEKLNGMVPMVHFGLDTRSYETVVELLANWDRLDPLVARLTPYVYLAADSLGADLVPLATYVSRATQQTTYHSWFVVRKQDLGGLERPTPTDVAELVSSGSPVAPGERLRFGYHSRFSTSSYFVPALFFLANNIFHMPTKTARMLAIESRKIDETSSSELVRQVARGAAPDSDPASTLDLAAVWDGTLKKFCDPSEGAVEVREDLWRCTVNGVELFFIRLPTELPNDLLVCSASVSEFTRRLIREAIDDLEPIDIGDFGRWKDIGRAGRARIALADLLRRARQVPATLTIDVRADPDSQPPVLAWQKKAVEEAVELSGTEFTVWERDFHVRRDFEWTLRLTHDGALELTSVPRSFERAQGATQTHIMSFEDEVDLIDRTTGFIRTRLHRVRRVWPYWHRPTVIRDVPFALPKAESRLLISRIVWHDLEHNHYRMDLDDAFESRVVASDNHKLFLDIEPFAKTVAGFDLDPMSNVWYRVLLPREERESATLRALTYAFVALLVLAAVAVVVDSWRPFLGALGRSRPRKAKSWWSGE